jgi:quercetin dioxygenase-like cupin family protein
MTMITSESEWVTGRVGMLYRDLTPDSLKPHIVVSNIRLPFEGEVPDYVHYHKVDFQMIYCKIGRIKVVYEDQGPPFWLETGDCVLQPPEIRHRVLECTAGAEVIEATMPAEHETCVEREIELPTAEVKPDRIFGGQYFVRHIAPESSDVERDTGIAAATGGFADVQIAGNENGEDTRLLLTLRHLGSEGQRLLSAPISLEIAI